MIDLRQVAPSERIWVNVGDGNVTSVVDISVYPAGPRATPDRRTLINFVGGGQVEIVGRIGADVVRAMTSTGGFGR